MFKINTSMIITNEEKLLFNIQELLIQQNKLIKESLQISNTIASKIKNDRLKIENKQDLSTLKRNELVARVKKMPNKPKGYIKLSNKDLIKLLQKE